ncbi:hypothetical protein B9J87_09410 [Vibrio sp. V19_P1S1T109]|nr:hypothetical protein B9J86_16180 [Vibrio sp. V06_P1A73T115]OXX20464.1 hypothetical protein B9J88_13775 [Vibrio sp. V05_P4A8T149]OXX36284.1 hypothetical protein B9J81_06320 [Vibrio sp. V04_P4A5T148]OXX55103.1 hypothetical protein B9J91_10130 [Vibrio sp. V18_P1S4T112]OXX72007.1 hypothetical protein B9J87_09410 [Vibrio sp. V19_P1S1T109]
MELIKYLLAFLCFILFFKLIRKQFGLDCHFVRDRNIRTLQMTLCAIVCLSVSDSEPIFYLLAAFLLVVIHCYTFVIKECEGSKLAIVPDLLNRRSVSVHLARPTQAFDKATYLELKLLISRLKKANVSKVTLCSPMLYKSDKARNQSRLNKLLVSEIKHIESKEVNCICKPLSVATLSYYKYIRREKSLQNLNVLKWYQIEIHLT